MPLLFAWMRAMVVKQDGKKKASGQKMVVLKCSAYAGRPNQVKEIIKYWWDENPETLSLSLIRLPVECLLDGTSNEEEKICEKKKSRNTVQTIQKQWLAHTATK